MAGSACAIYGPELVQTTGGEGGSGAVAGNVGAAGQGAMSVAGTGGDAVSGGTAGEATSGAPSEGGQPPEPETVPYLTVTIGPPFTDVSLTSEGMLYWAHFGLGGIEDRNQKAGVTSHLLDFTPTGAQPALRFLDGSTNFIWSDGTPTANGSTNDGLQWRGVGEGFELVIPAVTDVRKIRLYVGVSNGTGSLKASLSDPRANSIGDDRFSSPDTDWVLQVINIVYGNADMPDTTMTISWSLESGLSGNAAVGLTAISIGNGG
jgi:hypothetical protein